MSIRPEFQRVSARTKKVPYFGAIPFLSAEEGVQGVRVRVIRKESPAEAAGLQVGDIITAVNNQPVADYGKLIEVLRQMNAQDEVSVKVLRAEAIITTSVRLGRSK